MFFHFIVTRNPMGVFVRSLLSKEKLWLFIMWGGVVDDRSCGIGLITVSSYFFFHTNLAGVVVSDFGC